LDKYSVILSFFLGKATPFPFHPELSRATIGVIGLGILLCLMGGLFRPANFSG
jgi:hypothetical protein